jgi:hypothetical protein
VLNLASTLGTHPEHDEALERYGTEEHARDTMSQYRRLEDNNRARLELARTEAAYVSARAEAAYGDRVPSANILYDWSPATEADDNELDRLIEQLRRERPDTSPDLLRDLGRRRLWSERERIRSLSSRLSSDRPATGGESLRSTAILQSVRRHPRFSARTREYLQRYNSERDATSRPSQHSESPARYMSDSARQMAMQRLASSADRLDRERRDMLSRTDSNRRNYLDHRTAPSTPTVSPQLEKTVKYLSRIRQSETLDDSLNHALDADLLAKDYFCMQYADFLTDPSAIPTPAETSWLAPGAVLSGCQHATSVAAAPGTTAANQFRIYDATGGSSLSGLAPPSRPWLATSYSTPRPEAAPTTQQDRWPVKVTIHQVDWANMSLSATMEAYNVPSHPHTITSPPLDASTPPQYTRTSSITTYLEGEILDFTTHTLLTETFKSSAHNDATYWRKLPPFAALSDADVVRALTSKAFYANTLHKEWILMRWKERCFVKSNDRTVGCEVTFDDSGCGLTISGFYYVCLARKDGKISGLYFDPQSSPYQCLELESGGRGRVGSWEFR